jgi:hypothetical protein
VIALPLFFDTPPPPSGLPRAAAASWAAARLAESSAFWRARLARVPISLPPAGGRIAASLRASLAWILVNREGARIQPGPRCYRRSWIRDGSLTATALAEMGFVDEARAFLRWYAPYQHADGRVPCAVDRHGVDPVAEHDSHGQLVWAIVELFRLTGDDAFLRELWPRVVGAVDAIATLRAERTGEAFRGTGCFGLLPESISHEGYASRPVWDDFFALRALADAADAAAALGNPAVAERIGTVRDALRHDLHASIAGTMIRHDIDFVPGSVEAERLPRPALEPTFARYWGEFEARRRGEIHPESYTPYELRSALALLRLGHKERALAVLEWLLAGQRPAAWRQWPEIVWRDRRAPRFLGDLPHGWIASTFVRFVRRLFADERDDGSLVVAAGVPEAWVRDEPGVRVSGLATHFGLLDLTLRAEGAHRIHAAFGPGLRRPPNGIVLASPLTRPLREVVIDGRARASEDPAHVHLEGVPAEIVLCY